MSINDMVFLKGKNIYLRPPEKEDLSIFTRWLNDERIRLYTTRRKPLTLVMEEKIIENFNNDHKVFFVICESASTKPIGTIDYRLNWVNRRAELGIMIGEIDIQNKGYGRESLEIFLKYGFDTLNLHKICLEVYDFNERAIHLYESLGFKVEGHFRKHSFKNGKYVDLIYMGLFKEDLKKVKRRTLPREEPS